MRIIDLHEDFGITSTTEVVFQQHSIQQPKHGTTWYINLSDGKSLSSTSTTITVSLTNGTYNYTASSSGYKQKTGSITLNDNSVTVTVAFEKLSTVTPAKPVSYLVYVLIGVIVATIVIASAVLLMTRKKQVYIDCVWNHFRRTFIYYFTYLDLQHVRLIFLNFFIYFVAL